ncbi:hypothetical protein EXIGLDRAFT_751657 [Exidia glandulosa HHB12029]|uniref:Uncharacterized protein n=1 Tax=Exidia glandulosa HHB12029 TaxID=1314781 RepID=A0A165F7I7_EXIGL|nr:hypothetical protein EXIGLDRAFT_751657 [Exidia glandulosa HHB12029]
MTTPQGEPRPELPIGAVVIMNCSIKEPILAAIEEYQRICPLTASMASTRASIRSGRMSRPRRPCVVTRVARGGPMFVPLTTFTRQPVTTMDLHTQHFAVSIGNTTAFPEGRGKLVISPNWPLSYYTPCYAVAYEILVGTERNPQAYGRARENGRFEYQVQNDEIRVFRRIMRELNEEYENLTYEDRRRYNRTWNEAQRIRRQRQAAESNYTTRTNLMSNASIGTRLGTIIEDADTSKANTVEHANKFAALKQDDTGDHSDAPSHSEPVAQVPSPKTKRTKVSFITYGLATTFLGKGRSSTSAAPIATPA